MHWIKEIHISRRSNATDTTLPRSERFWRLRLKMLKQKTERYRIVPIQSRLIELGFIDYAQKQKEALFPVLPLGRDGKGQVVSKWYSRYRRSVGLTDTRNQDFHCYRHTIATELA